MSTPNPDPVRVERLLPACMAFFMSALVTATAVAVNSASMAGFGSAFLHAWALSLPVAVFAAYVTRPIALRLARLLATGLR
jgi:hypothetical protein